MSGEAGAPLADGDELLAQVTATRAFTVYAHALLFCALVALLTTSRCCIGIESAHCSDSTAFVCIIRPKRREHGARGNCAPSVRKDWISGAKRA